MWAAVREATLGLYPDGAAAKSNHAPLTYLEPAPEYQLIVEASGGYGEKTTTFVPTTASPRPSSSTAP